MMQASRRRPDGLVDVVCWLRAGICVAFLSAALLACKSTDGPELSFQLLTQALPQGPLSDEQLAALAVEEEPVLSLADVVSYDKSLHEMTLTDDAAARLRTLNVPVSGRPLVIRVGDEPIYAAAFWTPISSMSFDGVSIMQPLHAQQTTVQLELGYPSPAFYAGEDPRADPRIMDALDRAGKLR